ncbi:MAG: HIT domain-containing protein [Chloroflexota bacterium]|nr:HIT domain-containing protein [Chloroflexota bacterium]MDE2941256.1 HIT domain-containing protein [Chloroflexota bacterium]MDE3267810.1 HIT domain-containing protein [Chloroflexota bacterium]
MTDQCIFCRIARGDIPSDMLDRDHTAFVIRDINPKASTHLLVIPLEHVTRIADFKVDGGGLLGHMMLMARDAARREGMVESGYRLVINQGPDSGQEVDHLHLHVLGGNRLGAMG